MVACFLGKKKHVETTTTSLKLLGKLHPGDALVSIKITQIYHLCPCGVYEK